MSRVGDHQLVTLNQIMHIADICLAHLMLTIFIAFVNFPNLLDRACVSRLSPVSSTPPIYMTHLVLASNHAPLAI